jgi:DNA-binding response OmpR family regulator
MTVVQKRILYAENQRIQLETRSKLLELEGYEVINALTPQEAENALERENIHLAILDIRLVDDKDEADISGLLLARDERFKRVPKIFVTGYPTFEDAREALGSAIGSEPIAYAFLSKKEGTELLIEAVKSAFEKVVGIDWNLRILPHPEGMLTFPHLVLLIEKDIEPSLLPVHSSELEDIFRRLFLGEEQVSFVRLNWQRPGCACLTLFSHKKGTSRQAVALIGNWEAIQEEHQRIEQFMVKGTTLLPKPSYAESLHFAGLVTFLPDAGGEPIQTAADFFEKASDKMVRTVLEDLYQRLLPYWHQQERQEIKKADLAALYRDGLGIHTGAENVKETHSRLQTLAESAQQYSLVKSISLDGNELEIVFPNGIFHRGPDPLASLFDPQAFSKFPAVICTTFGGIPSRSLLIDEQGQVHPTDLSSITRSPLLEDFISMESEFHFERIISSNLLSRWDLEQQIAEAQTLNDTLTVGNVEPECRKALAAIQSIRKLAAEATGEALEPYLIGLFHHVLKKIVQFDPEICLAKYQVVQLIHRLLLASIILTQITRRHANGAEANLNPGQDAGLKINTNSHEVNVDGRIARLTQTEYKLLTYLYENPNRLCTRKEILAEVFNIKESTTENDKGLLNSHLDRLRKKIDLNPSKHRYIVTIRGEGYMLDLKP